MQVMPSKEEENSHSEVKEEKTANAGLTTLTDKKMNVIIAGSGNVAESLARAMSRAGVEVVQVYARNETRGREVAGIAHAQWCGAAEELLPCLLYTSDAADE